jgi:hypothetical protein
VGWGVTLIYPLLALGVALEVYIKLCRSKQSKYEPDLDEQGFGAVGLKAASTTNNALVSDGQVSLMAP